MPINRIKKWKTKTDPDLLKPRLDALHEISSEEIAKTYSNIDAMYARAKPILDKAGIIATTRIGYRAYMEELWKNCSTFTRATRQTEADSVTLKYVKRGLEPDVLQSIANLFGLTVVTTLGEGVPVNHNLLSATHLDTLPASVVAGDLIFGNATPKWARLPKDIDGKLLKLISGLPAWAYVDWVEVTSKPLTFPPTDHHVSHEKDGLDEVSLDAEQTTSGTFDLDRIPAIDPAKLDAIDSPADGEAATYNVATGKFEWTEVAKKGISDLSELKIDVSKDWLGFVIKNLGAPIDAGDVYSKGNAIDLGDIPTPLTGKDADSVDGCNAGLSDGDVAKLPVATVGKILKRGAAAWEAGDCQIVTSVDGSFTFTPAMGTDEQTVLELVLTEPKRVHVFFDMFNVDEDVNTPNALIWLYYKIDGSNYRVIDGFNWAYGDKHGLVLHNLLVAHDLKVTMTMSVALNANASIPYNYLTEEW